MKLNRAQKLALNLDSHIVVDAGAGTGKTSTIVDRVIEHYLSEDQRATRILPKPERPPELQGGILAQGKSETQNLQNWGGLLPGEVVLLTFTNKAADEMKDRLRSRLTRLGPGPISDDGKYRRDPRIHFEGFNEQLLTLLDDAPIGTIDSFFNQLIAPYRGMLGDSLSQENVSDSGRILLTESGLNTLWRLSSNPNRFYEAVDAGMTNNRNFGPKEILAARDRIQRRYASRRRAINIIRNLANRSIFIDEAVRDLGDSNNKIIPDKLQERILESIDCNELNDFSGHVQRIISQFCDLVKQFPNELGSGWGPETRIACLDHLSSIGSNGDSWNKLIWLSNILHCTASPNSLFTKGPPSIFPRGNLPNDSSNWDRGIENLGKVSKIFKSTTQDFKELWSSDEGEIILHFTRIAMLLDQETPPCTPSHWVNPLVTLPDNIPESPPSLNNKTVYRFTIEQEAQNLDDLRTVLIGFRGIMAKLKEVNEVHDYDDIQDLAGDLLLANCPLICESFYPEDIISALNNPPKKAWRDDHIYSAFSILESFESNPKFIGDSSFHLKETREDLTRRFDLLKKIRRRYRAFIIDEAQDNSPLQWRLLSRLWGPRLVEDGDPDVPNTEWQPTICYVGDIKQSIYAFRQAEVTGFRQYAMTLRDINKHEYLSIPQLTTPGRELRDIDFSRDPRNSHQITIANAKKHYVNGGQDLLGWIPFKQYDGWETESQKETDERKEGLISLKINYRTDAGLLEVMNEWWGDIFHPRHRKVTNGGFYADSQQLYACKDKSKESGGIEWICPLNAEIPNDPSTDLNKYLDAFTSGTPDSLERQGMMVARRIKYLIEGKPVRVLSPSGRWDVLPACEKVPPSEIMVLLPSRRNIRDIIIRYLNDFGISSQADREGGLLERPAVHSLDGLIQFIARPKDAHSAAWVARSCLIGFNDEQTQEFIGMAENNENLLHRLSSLSINSRQKELVKHWIELSEQGRINELLEDTLDNSDLLLTYSDNTSLQDVEQFSDLIRALVSEVGGDSIVIADRIRQLRESESSSMEAITIPPKDAVRIMTIHGSKGLQASVVFLIDICSNRQTNLTIDSRSRTMVSPELFAGNPIPWTDKQDIKSATWLHTKWLYQSRKDAEARRLLYVGATRAKHRLIIVGSPKGTTWIDDSENGNSGLKVPWKYNKSLPQLGQIWLESLRQGAYRRGENKSIWNKDTDFTDTPFDLNTDRYLDPFAMKNDSFIGSDLLKGMVLLHHQDCFDTDNINKGQPLLTPSQRIIQKNNAAKSSVSGLKPYSEPRLDSNYRVRTAPHRLSQLSECSRRHWLETRGGLKSAPLIPLSKKPLSNDSFNGIDPALLGSIVHRIVEIGMPNPGLLEEKSPQLPNSWIKKNPNNMVNEKLHDMVYTEMLSKDSDKLKIKDVVIEMTNRLSNSKFGQLISGEVIEGEKVEGLRTEMPFHISFEVPLDGLTRTRWTPQGLEPLSLIDKASVQMDGFIDLVLCTVSSEGPTIRPIDLKTEEAYSLRSRKNEGLLESLGEDSYEPKCDAEFSMLNHHRMQLALYYRALKRIEASREEPRKVLRPAIWVGVTGRLVEYPEVLFQQAQSELDELLIQVAKMELDSNDSLSNHPPLSEESCEPCKSCPFSKGQFPICGPVKQEL